MIAIITRYMPATDTRGARYRATWDSPQGLRSLTMAADYGMDSTNQHMRVATLAAGSMYLTLIGSAPAPGGKGGWVHIAQEVEQ